MNVIQALRTLTGLTGADGVHTRAPVNPPSRALFAVVEDLNEFPRSQFFGNSSVNQAIVQVSLFAPPRKLDGLPPDAIGLLDLFNQVASSNWRKLVTEDITPGLNLNHPFEFVGALPPRFDRVYSGETANIRFRVVRQRQ
jgi:hypothetical protein